MNWLVLSAIALMLSLAAAPSLAWEPEQFPIGYWHGPPPDANNLDTWRTVKEANFTFAGPRGGYSVEQNLQRLDFCRQVGLKAMVVDGRIAWQMVADDDWEARIGEVVGDYGEHPALYGYYLRDEPNFQLFESLGKLSGEFLKRDPKHLPYINLFPTYASVRQLGTPTYWDHLDEYMRLVQPAVLSYDHYCLLRDGTDRPDYFENLELIRKAGLRHHTPQWNIILSLSHLAYRDPTEGEMRWQVYTSLAYGMKGIMYFTYWTEPSWEARGEIGIVDSKGKPARLHPIVKQLNAEMIALGTTLLGLTSTGVFHTGEIPKGCARLGADAVVRLPQDVPLLVGFFEDKESRKYVFLVNRDHDNAVEFEAEVLPHVKQVRAVSAATGDEEEVAVVEGAAKFTLPAGGGCLCRLVTDFAYPQPPRPVTEIDFRFETAGQLEGWSTRNALASPVVGGDTLTMTFTGADPYVARNFLRVAADRYTKIMVRMRLESGSTEGQLFWTTQAEPSYRDDKYLNFPVLPDGRWHEYTIPVGEHPKWRGQAIRALRLDPVTGDAKPGTKVQIDWIRGE